MAGVNGQRQRLSANRPTNGATIVPTAVTQNIFNIPFTLNYEVDLFGRVRHSLEAANASLQASAADLENVRLLVSSELAADYFQLRELDAEMAVVQKAIDFRARRTEPRQTSATRVVQFPAWMSRNSRQCWIPPTRNWHCCSSSARSSNMRSRCYKDCRLLNSKRRFALWMFIPPAVPVALPSELLQRRPDIATAERQVAAANAQIGVAKSAFYPSISLGGSGGFQSARHRQTGGCSQRHLVGRTVGAGTNHCRRPQPRAPGRRKSCL